MSVVSAASIWAGVSNERFLASAAYLCARFYVLTVEVLVPSRDNLESNSGGSSHEDEAQPIFCAPNKNQAWRVLKRSE